MKKIISLISSLVLAAGMTSALAVNAADSTYKPTLYFKADEGKGVEILKYGAVYVNKKVAGDDASVPVSVYFKDDQKIAGQVFVKWISPDKSLVLENLTGPFEKTGGCPFKISGISSDADLGGTLKTFKELNVMAVSYTETDAKKPLQLTGETSDAYPLACFEAKFEQGAKGGSYDINFYDEGAYVTSVVPRYVNDLQKLEEVYPAEYSEGLLVNASDRLLGDVNSDGHIDSVDASLTLSIYAKLSSSKDPEASAEELAAADVDGNRKVDSVDASSILGYYVYLSSNKDSTVKTLNEYVKS